MAATAAGALVGLGGTAAEARGRPPRRILLRGGTVISQDPKIGVLPRGDVLITGDKITRVAKKIQVDGRDTQIIDAVGFAVMPGMVDNHRHLWTRLFAGVSVDHLFGTYFQLISQKVSPRLTPKHMRLAGYLGGLEALNAGITTVLDWNHACYTRDHAFASVVGLARSGVRGVFGYAAPSIAYGPDVPPSDDDIAALKRFTDALPGMSLAIPPRSPRQVATVPGGLDRIREDIERARALKLPITMHTGLDTAEDFVWLLDNGLVGPDSTYIHANLLTQFTFEAIADRGGFISSSPEVEMQMFGLAAPLRSMMNAGVNITFSSDLPASQRADLLTQMKIGLQTQRMFDYRDSGGTAPVLPTATTLDWVTTQAARSLMLEDTVGSLTPGKAADVIMVNLESPSTLGVADPLDAVLAYGSLADIDTVIAGGRIVKRDGALTANVDTGDLHHDVLVAQRELLSGL